MGLLGRLVFRGENQRAAGVQDAGVDQPRHAGLAGGIDDGSVLPNPLADLAAGDQQDRLGALQGGEQCVRLVMVRTADGHSEVGRLLGRTGRSDDLASRQLVQQAGDDVAAEVTAGAGNDDHDASFQERWPWPR